MKFEVMVNIKKNLMEFLKEDYSKIRNELYELLEEGKNNTLIRNDLDRIKTRMEQIDRYDTSSIYSMVDDLCNLNIKTIIGLSEKNTYILRKRLGVFDNGIIQTCYKIAKSMPNGVSSSYIYVQLNYNYGIRRKIRKFFDFDKFYIKCSKLSLEEILSIRIDDEDFPKYFYLSNLGIETIEDIINMPIKYINEHYYKGGAYKEGKNGLFEFIHRLGLLFCDENYDLLSKKTILESNGYGNFIMFEVFENFFKYFNVNSIGELIKLKKSDIIKHYNGTKIVKYIHNLGLYFSDEITIMQGYLTEIHDQLDKMPSVKERKLVKLSDKKDLNN